MLNVKFSDNLNVILKNFFFQKASKITWKRSFIEQAKKTGVLCFILHVGDLVLVFNIKRVIIGME